MYYRLLFPKKPLQEQRDQKTDYGAEGGKYRCFQHIVQAKLRDDAQQRAAACADA